MRFVILPFFLFCTCIVQAQQYVISTFAGGAPLPTPSAAVNASIGDPPRVAVDGAGNIYFGSMHSVFKVNQAGNITLVAGNGRSGYAGDGGLATAAQLEYPDGIAVDASGNIYVADMQADVVRVIAPAGTISTYAGLGTAGYSGDGGAAPQAQLNTPMGLALDAAGNLYIADSGNNVVRKVSKSGAISTAAGNGSLGYSGDGAAATAAALDEPEGVTVDPSSGQVYIADTFNNRVRVVSPAGIIQTAAGTGISSYSGDGGAAATAGLFLPTDVATDSDGNLYIADYGNSRIREVAQGKIQTVVGGNGTSVIFNEATATTIRLNGPTGLAVDSSGDIFLAEGGIGTGTGLAIGDYRVWEINSGGVVSTAAGNGIESYSGDGGPATAAQINKPTNLVFDAVGNLYIADSANNRVRKVSPSGVITTAAGNGIAGYSGDGGQATSAMLNSPEGLASDSDGNVYIADTQNNRIRKLLPNGTILSIAGNGNAAFLGDGGPANAAALHAPQGIYFVAGEYVYIADTGNQRIRELLPNGTITTVAGNGTQGAAGDGGAATAAELSLPTGVTLDSTGNLYITDQGNNRVRLVSTNGTISTFAGAATYALGDGGLATAAQLSAPSSVAVDASGNVYIADTGHNRIRVVSGGSAGNTIDTLAGTGVCCYSGDGGPATAAQLNAPWGLLLDASGRLYVADSGNNSVRLIQTAPSGGLPTISAITNGASNQTGAVADGEIVVIYGSGLGPAQIVAAPGGAQSPQQLDGVTVLVNGTPASLIYVSAGQLSAIIPNGIAGANAQVVVQYQSLSSAPTAVPLTVASPALFTANSSGSGQALAVNSDGSSNGASHPAPQGSVLTLFVNGVVSQFLAGALSVTIEGQPATIVSSTPSPSAPGVTTVQVQAPYGIPASTTAPVMVQVGSANSPAGVTVAVAGS
jgi:trimeric autotransporter adhesin